MSVWIWVILAAVVAVIGLALLTGRKRTTPPTPKPQLAGEGETPDNKDPVAAQESEPELNYTFDGVAGADRFGPAVLAAGSRIMVAGTTYLVVGTGALKEDRGIWYEHLLQGGDSPHWLSVEDIDDEIRLGWWDNRAELTVAEDAEDVEVDGATYRRIAEGDAVFAVSGLTGAVTQGEYRYVDFVTDDGVDLLRIETWGADAEPGVSTGRFISYEDIEVYPPEPAAE